MRGAVAAGHRLTAEAGARVLAEGGNAVDACVAAGLASWVCESTLTGPGGAGFMLVHRARDRSDRVLDFFAAVPGQGLEKRPREMESVDVAYGPESSQLFYVGAASCAVPGAAAGLEAAHRAFGRMPFRVLAEPAVELARRGVELNAAQAHLHLILDQILRHTDEGRRIYGFNGGFMVEGDRLTMPDLAATIELIAERGAGELYGGELGRTVARYIQDEGGEVTVRDLESYRVVRRRPIRVAYLGHELISNPPPSSGGILIGYGLRLLDRLGVGGPPGSDDAMSRLVEVMREQTRARRGGFARDLYRGGLVRRLLGDGAIDAAVERVEASEAGVHEPAPPGGTTHISVVDAHGNAASLSVSTGSGSGMIVPGTGVHLNNMLGEWDLAPTGGAGRPGDRFTSMMAPSLVLCEGEPRLVVGSAGSLRLRGAILQTIVNVVGHGLDVEEAIGRPRVHLEDSIVHCEAGGDAEALDRLEARGYSVVRWGARNLYFGGTSAVQMREDGSLAAAGDPRRDGVGVVVE
jgi:gamma-glutamyltranspeptidase/glutathione hydrolase